MSEPTKDAQLALGALKKCVSLLEDQIDLLKQEKASYEKMIEERESEGEDGSETRS